MYDILVEKLIEVDETEVSERPAVATRVSPEKAMRDFYKEKINGKLKGSTWTSEEDWLKFWMFRNGDYIPVDYSHAKTSGGVHLFPMDLESVGMIQGSIKVDDAALSVGGNKPLSSQQISRLRQFYIQYKPDSLYVSFPEGRRTIGSFRTDVKSSGDLDYALEYGLDENIEEAIQVPEFLYHGTFKPLLDKIKSEGLRTKGTVKNYSDSEEGFVYLAKTFEEAEAFAEVSETVPDEWIDQIVVLRIETDKLDKSKLEEDPNVRDTEVMTFQYSQDIPPGALEVIVP